VNFGGTSSLPVICIILVQMQTDRLHYSTKLQSQIH
jgi:hypothetical protein